VRAIFCLLMLRFVLLFKMPLFPELKSMKTTNNNTYVHVYRGGDRDDG
jgi:hypothetical protein